MTALRAHRWQSSQIRTVSHRRSITSASISALLTPPAVFLGLLISLWTYKCLMTIIFQDKIIYMPYMPPFARSERMEAYVDSTRPVHWSTRSIHSKDGVRLTLCVGAIHADTTNDAANWANAVDVDFSGKGNTAPSNATTTAIDSVATDSFKGREKYVVCYFQGNGASTPPRLPMLSQVLRAILAQKSIDVTVVALSYRGYWTSSGSASETGIRKDAQALLDWVVQNYGEHANVILWGQSIGAGVACAAAVDAQSPPAALILETPFTRIKSMLEALYPQRWLPYRYLWPFLWNHWDNIAALNTLAANDRKPPVLLLVAKRDEVVPPIEADKIEHSLIEHGFVTDRVDILGSLHTEATTRREGQLAIAQFMSAVVDTMSSETRYRYIQKVK